MPARGLEEISDIARSLSIPIIAIGGITPENTKDILASEVSGIAVMSGIVSSSNPYSKAKSYKESIRKWAENMCKKYDVAIIGGGVIGSSVAHFLAERGHKVAIVEKQQIASEASKAAAGLLGVQAEWDAYDPLFDLARESRAIFPQLAAVLREKQVSILGMKRKVFTALLKMKRREKEFFILWIGSRKQVKILTF